ncbi:MAG TPA: hypothetical protein VF792_13065 [Ktedonobacterales bacterium]
MLTFLPFSPHRMTTTLASAVLLAALTLAGCDASAPSAARRPSAMPSPTATVAPRILYQADFTQRASEWTLPPHWSIANGALTDDGAGFNSITIPYEITAQAYSVNIQIRVSAINGSGYNNQYRIDGYTPAGKLLYTASVSSLNQQNHGFSQVFPAQPDPNNPGFGTYDFTPGVTSRAYNVQVDGRYINFVCGGSSLTTVTSALPLAPARIELVDQSVRLTVESVTITTP